MLLLLLLLLLAYCHYISIFRADVSFVGIFAVFR